MHEEIVVVVVIFMTVDILSDCTLYNSGVNWNMAYYTNMSIFGNSYSAKTHVQFT